MKKKLLSLTEASTEFVEKNNLQYYWKVDDFKFSNIHLMRWYEDTYKCSAMYIAEPLPLIKKTLKNKDIDLNYNYNLDYLKKLRNENQSLKLLFSGGYDSVTVFLEAVENNIIFDQVISCITGYNDSSVDLPENAEVKNNVLPYIEKYKSQIKDFNFILSSRENLRELYKDPYAFFKPTCTDAAPFNYRQIWSEFKNNKQDCYIRGNDKPTLLYYNKSWYAVLLDVAPGSTPYSNVKHFWLEPENIKSLIKDALLYRKYILDQHGTPGQLSFFKPGATSLEENLVINRKKVYSTHCQYPKRIVGETSSIKDNLAMIDSIHNVEYNLLSDYFCCLKKFQKIFPDCKTNYNKYNNRGKFGWLIDIDSLEAFSQQELIPNGFIE